MRCDGMDVLDTHAVVAEAVERVREERRPLLIEAVTYRFRGHSMADPEQYRTKDEVESWRRRDPIPAFGERLVQEGVLDGGELEAIDAAAIARVDAAVEFADASPFPEPGELFDDVYVLGDAARGWYSVETTDERAAGPGRRRGGRGRRRRDPAAAHERARRGRRGRRDGAAGGELMASAAGEMRYREALGSALREELRRDERVMLMGEDIGVFGGAFKVTEGLLEEFGERRVRDTPISENTIVGMGVGAAMAGLRPVVELMTINFSLLAFDQIVNHAAHIHYMFGGQARVPLVVRMPQGAGHQLGPTHSHCFEAMYLHVPGLLVAVPATPADAKGLLKTAIRDENPVIFIEHESLYGTRGEVPDGRGPPGPLRRGARRARGLGRDDRGHLADGADRRARGRDAVLRARHRGRGDRPAHAAAAGPRHDPRVGQADEPLRDRRGGLAARRRRREPRGADRRTGLRRPRRAGAARDGRGRADALLQAAGGHRLPARAAGRAAALASSAARELGDAMTEIVMPRLSDTMEEGTILRWLKADGEEVARGEELVEIETDKATMVYESDQAGTLKLIGARGRHAAGRSDDRAGGRRGRWRRATERLAVAAHPRPLGEATAGELGGAALPRRATPAPLGRGRPRPRSADGGRVKASPLARRIAARARRRLHGARGQRPRRADREGRRARGAGGRSPAAAPAAHAGVRWPPPRAARPRWS